MAGDFPNLSATTISKWPNANTVDPVSRDWFPAYSVILSAFASLILFGRILSQIRKSASGFGIDDALACMGCIFAILFTTVCLIGTLRFGFDRHMWDVETVLYRRAALIEWLGEGAFVLSTSFTKLSVLCFYRRLEIPVAKAVVRTIRVFIASTACYTVACLLTQILLCRPLVAYFDVPGPDHSIRRNCASEHLYYPIQGSLGTFSTFYSIMIPVLVLRNIPMSSVQRTGLRIVSLVALVAFGAGIARTVSLSRLADSENGDATWNAFNVFIWAQLECQVALICASLPYLQRYLPQYPSVPLAAYPDGKARSDSVISRVGSSLSGQIKRLPFGHNATPQKPVISRPRVQAIEIPEWEFQTLGSPSTNRSPIDEISYDRYVLGMFGPSPPPKDSTDVFDQYRREHGDFV